MKSNEFLLVLRSDHHTKDKTPLPEQLEKNMKNWQDWLKSLAVQDFLTSQLKRWDANGRILSSDGKVTDGPYAEVSAVIDGLITISAIDYQEAKEIAQSCPVLAQGGTIEIRMTI